MGNSNNNATFLERFQNLLKDLFQFDASDLDFGIYRILNHKRKQIDKFITTDLVKNVEDAFSKHKGEKLENIEKELKEAREEIYNNINITMSLYSEIPSCLEDGKSFTLIYKK